ncbi:MAG: hypothetical protein LBV34_11565, partial [Nocardiopsaceae bacterium]|nr:hypothetical protein [Nocardiopsaceae bacterium]
MWAIALDALAAAGEAAVAATAERDLMAGTADALAGPIAEWVIVDLAAGGRGSRSVAGGRSRPRRASEAAELAAAVAGLGVSACPLTTLAMDHGTPLV